MTKFLKTNYNQTIAYNKIDGEKVAAEFEEGRESTKGNGHIRRS